ncbi:MAG TPA: radical SAM family heme chaperone HemW [Terriglobales bacterium]|nr:radical SAM family heme chaperone HemW [Terriglobales bacterium]
MPLGLYVSVPFCRTKCTYCNFASGVFARGKYESYVSRLCGDIAAAPQIAAEQEAKFDPVADSVYLGGGTPTILEPEQLKRIFAALRQRFEISADAEITIECAPGSLSDEILEALLISGVSRVSLGVQSFIDQEARAVGRLHTRGVTLTDIERLRRAGIRDINVDLIAGLPHQTAASWETSLAELIASGVPHASVYMLEVDEDSRLGTELVAGGTRYHAHHVPDDDVIAELYEFAWERLHAASLEQYEISNFARKGHESKHNLKYWTRQPYFGFGVDAHSMLPPNQELVSAGMNVIRFFWPDTLEGFLSADQRKRTPAKEVVSISRALEEEFFLGLRLGYGLDLGNLRQQYGDELLARSATNIADLCHAGLLRREGTRLFLTARGRLLSNEVFEKFVALEDERFEVVDAERHGALPMQIEPKVN